MNWLRGLVASLIERSVLSLALFAGLILAIGTIFYHHVEQLRWLDALYFSSATLTTVGYGDFTPKTDPGKIFTIFYLFVGIGIILAFIQAIASKTSRSNPANYLFRKQKSKK